MNPFGALMTDLRHRPGDPYPEVRVPLRERKRLREADGARVHLMEDDEPELVVLQKAPPPPPPPPRVKPVPVPKPRPAVKQVEIRARKPAAQDNPWELSDKQLACIAQLDAGHKSGVAAKNLGMNEKTVATHIVRARGHMGLATTSAVVDAYRSWKFPNRQEHPMTYEPRGKVAVLADAMRKDPGRIWTSQEVAAVMNISQAAVSAHLDAPIRHGAIHRKLENGKCKYNLRPFVEAPAPALQQPRIPVFKTDFSEKNLPPQHGDGTIIPAAAPPPTPPPTQAPAPQPDPAAEVHADPGEEVPFNACLWIDGDLHLYGLVELEDGGYAIPAANLVKLCRLLHGQGPAE